MAASGGGVCGGSATPPAAESPDFGGARRVVACLRERLGAPVLPCPPRGFPPSLAAGGGGVGAAAGGVAGVTAGGLTTTAGLRTRATLRSPLGVNVTACQSGSVASLRNPARSGKRSISEAKTAGSIFRCWLDVVEDLHSPDRRVLESVVWRTSRCPMSFDANSEVPPSSLAEQRNMTVVPQFSTMVWAVLFP